MKEGWECKKLSDVGTVVTGSTPSTKDADNYNSCDVCFVKPSDIPKDGIGILSDTEFHISNKAYDKSRKLPIGSVLTTCIGIVGKVGILKVEATCNQQINAIIPNTNIVPSFLAYSILSKKQSLEKTANAPVVPIINKKDFSNTTILVPPLLEQQHIVEELDLLSSIIEKKKAQLIELDNLAQSLFYEMFGDPITNEKGWQVNTLGKECTELKYGTSKPACENGKYKYLRMGNLTINGELDLSSLKTIDIPDDEVEKCIVRYGDILFNRTNSLDLIGKTCMFNLEEPMVIAGYIIRVRLSKNLKPRYISAMFNLPRMKLLLKKMAKGAVNQANINSKELASILVPIPPLDLQQQFATKIEAIEHQKELIKQSIKEVETLLNSRMDYYFN